MNQVDRVQQYNQVTSVALQNVKNVGKVVSSDRKVSVVMATILWLSRTAWANTQVPHLESSQLAGNQELNNYTQTPRPYKSGHQAKNTSVASEWL